MKKISTMKHRFLFLGLLSFLLLGCGAEDDAQPANSDSFVRPAKLATAVSVLAAARREFPGTVEAAQHSALAFRVSGELVQLPVKAGDAVKKGQILAQLDQADYKNALSDRQAKYDLAKVQYDQIKALIEKQYASKTRLDEVRASLKAARSALSMAQDNLRYTTLTAPFDGVVARVDVENYQSVQAMNPILELQDASDVDIVFSVPEALLTKLNPETARSICGEVRFDARPDQRFNACYKKHETVPDPLTRTYQVVFGMPQNAQFSVLPGMSVSVMVDLSPIMLSGVEDQGVAVPMASVFEEAGSTYVWRLDEQMRTLKTQVKVLRIYEHQLLITGIEPDEQVIAAGVHHVQAGQKVRPLIKERGL
jgi:RND family efflux transporter MFP subunit